MYPTHPKIKNTAVNVLQMCICGNRHVINKMGEMLYFPNWIKSGIVPINDLKVVNSKIYDKHLFAKLGNKLNYISEIYQVKQGVHCLLSENVTCTPSLTIKPKYLKFLTNFTRILFPKGFYLQNHMFTPKVYLI